MDRNDDERLQMLLGKHLLGKATEDEVRELRARRDADAAFREAMDVARGSAANFRRSAAGEEVRLTPADLPDYLRPQELARGLERWFWQWLAVTVASAVAMWTLLVAAAVNIVRGADPAHSARIGFVSGGIALAVIVVRAWFARESLAARIAAGGPSWERTVAAVRKQEKWFLSPLGTSLMWIGFALTAASFVVAGTLHRPATGYALLAATGCLAFTLKIAKRRFLLRGLSGGREWLS